MVNLKELTTFLETMAPKEMAESYDNVGLLIEGVSENIHKVLIALDADENTVRQAEEQGIDLIISHHPLIFKPLARLTEATGNERTVRRLLQKGIGLYAMHTNFDAAENGLCDLFLDSFGDFKNRSSFASDIAGIGRVGDLAQPCTLEELLKRGQKSFQGAILSYVGALSDSVSKVAVCNGGGGDLVYDAYHLGAEVYISGDFKHHHARFALENGLMLIGVSHYDAEIGFCKFLAQKLNETFGGQLEIVVSHEKNPWHSY
ncbi:MAG: Nif3-like dinuclear metal center hexameric protein [Clostridia bacterium]|nr:Nif3-like dinuclear metal center hexameric protein [Clostridia bacterium]